MPTMTQTLRRKLLAALTGLALTLSQPAQAGFEEGAAAYRRGDYAAALKELRPLAEQGDAKAQVFLGAIHHLGQGVPEDYREAVTWYRKAAEQGSAEGQFALGTMYDTGRGVPQDYKEAVTWYRKAAEQGFAPAQKFLGAMYAEGRGVPQDFKEAVTWYRKAAEQGNAEAQESLGSKYAGGQGVPQDKVLAYALFNLSAAANSIASENARHKRDSLAEGMSPAELTEGQALTRQLMQPGNFAKVPDARMARSAR